MIDNSQNKKPIQPAEVVDTWVRLVMFHQRKTQGEIAEELGVSNSTLHNWLKGGASPDPLVLLRLMVKTNTAWIKLMAWQCLQAIEPAVFLDTDLCAHMVDVRDLEEMGGGGEG